VAQFESWTTFNSTGNREIIGQVERMKLGIPTNTRAGDQGAQQNEVVPWWVYFVGFFLPMPLDRLLRLPFIVANKPVARNPDHYKKEAS
jgi:hypothetical protein